MTARDRIVILVIVAAVAIAGSWLFVIQPKRDQASKLGSQVSAAQSQLSSANSELAQAESARGTFDSDYAELVRLGEAVPADDNVPSLIYEIQSAANAASVDFRSLTLSSTSGSGSSTSSSSSSSSSASSAATLPPGVSVGPAGFPAEQFSFSFSGDFFHLANFFDRLERFVVANNNSISVRGRLMTLNAINLSAGPKGFPQITATVSATTFLEPASQGVLNGATSTGPATSAGAQPTTSTGSSAPAPSAAAITPTIR